jgi:putative acyl-CoA dehydrogenase
LSLDNGDMQAGHTTRAGHTVQPGNPPEQTAAQNVHRVETHDVFNQVPPFEGYDFFTSDRALVNAVRKLGNDSTAESLSQLGALAGSAAVIERGFTANRRSPELHTHDRYGHRRDEVVYHPAYHALMTDAVAAGLHASPWESDAPHAHLTRAAGFLVWSQAEAAHLCPVSMTYAAVPALRRDPALAGQWVPGLASREYDPRSVPAQGKTGLLAGMAMTEKQGGSDVRAGTTRAVPDPASGPGAYRLTGHKWFCSAPMSDLFLVIAQTDAGVTCFVLPRILPDGSHNPIRLMRLKDKLGNRANASAEVEYEGALGWLLGEPGRGVPTITAMVNATRLDCVLGSAALMRQGVAQAAHHARYRSAFGQRLADAPLMQAVIADLAVESEAATLLGMRLAQSMDAGDEQADFRRLATAVSKYHVCKRGPAHTAEALECLGGNGYVEDSGLPRLYREAPVNSVWEGSGNVNALDVLRVIGRSEAALHAVLTEIELGSGVDRHLDASLGALRKRLTAGPEPTAARQLVEHFALLLQGSLLVRYSEPAVADAFCASRLGSARDSYGISFGTLGPGADVAAIAARATPAID